MKNYIKYFGILALAFASCEPEFENPVDEPGAYTSGEANLSNYVALGNSLTAGFADNSLYLTGQLNSYPKILADQFAVVVDGDFDFVQPLVADNAGGLLLQGEPLPGFGTRLVLAVGPNGPAPRPYTGDSPSTEVSDILTGPFNNMGVPGAKSFHLVAPGYGNIAGVETGASNPYFVRFASSPNATVLADAAAQEPTFFSLWIGNNDVLSYATSGGTGVDQTGNPNPSSYGSNDITDPQVFAQVYSILVNTLTADGAGGVLINIPDVTDIPFFTTVPYAPLSPTNPNFGPMIPTLNATFAGLNPALLALRGVQETEAGSEYSIEFRADAASPVIIRDESLPNISEQLTQVLIQSGLDPGTATIYGMQFGQVRQATAEDLLVLTSSSVIGTVNQERVQGLMALGVPQATAAQLSVNGVTYPLQDRYVLTADEIENIQTAQTAYNQVIQQLAGSKNLAYVDAAAILDQVADEGVAFDGGVLTSTFASGGAFSLDGVHLTPRGNAFMANQIIEAINETYNATVPKVNIGAYGTITPSNEVE